MVANHVASSLRGSNPRRNVGYAGELSPVFNYAGALVPATFATRAHQTHIHDT